MIFQGVPLSSFHRIDKESYVLETRLMQGKEKPAGNWSDRQREEATDADCESDLAYKSGGDRDQGGCRCGE